jgi:hypothetical protein
MAPSKQPTKSASAKKDDKYPTDGKAGTPTKTYKQKIIDGDRATNSPAKTPANENNVWVLKTCSGDMLMYMERANGYGEPPFIVPTIQELRRNEGLRKDILRINQMHDKVSPTNPNQIQNIPVGTRERQFTMFVHIVETGNEGLNNPVNRRLWADTFVHYFNHPDNRRAYKYPMTARFAGDLTPSDETTAPHMSRYLTIRDTMSVMQEALKHQSPDMEELPIGLVLENEEAMEDYYAPDHLALARTEFAIYARHSNVDGGSGPFAGLNAFDYNRSL